MATCLHVTTRGYRGYHAVTMVTPVTASDLGDLDRGDRQPLYQQLAGHIRVLIRSGRIKPGRRIPSRDEIQQRYGHEVSKRTVDSATAMLKEEGLIEAEHGKGFYVLPPDRWHDATGS